MTIHDLPRSHLLFRSTKFYRILYPIYQFLWESFVTRGQIYDPKGPEQWEIATRQFRRRALFSGYQALSLAFVFTITGTMFVMNESSMSFGLILIAVGIYCGYIAPDLIKYTREAEIEDKIHELENKTENNTKSIKNLEKQIGKSDESF